MCGLYLKIRLSVFFIGIIILSIGIIPTPGHCELFTVEEGVSYKEITVQKGVDFVVRLPGGGWYLNRFDRMNLSFKTRVNEPEYTEFVIQSLHEGPSYLFFSFLKKDIYVLVKVVDIATQVIISEEDEIKNDISSISAETLLDELPELTSLESIEKMSEKEKDKKIIQEKIPGSLQQYIQSEETQHKKEPQISLQAEHMSDEEIFYIDKDNRKVTVPYTDENDVFNKGVRLFDKGMFSEALGSFQEYFSDCERCVYLDEAYLRSAKACMKIGNEGNALKHLQKLIEHGSDKYKKEANFLKAEIDFGAGRIEEALHGYRMVLEFDPKNRELLMKTGDIYFQVEDYENALNMYEKAVEEGNESDELYFRIAIIYDSPGKLRNLEKAYGYYKILIDRYASSKHYSYAKKRVEFLEKNFYKYK